MATIAELIHGIGAFQKEERNSVNIQRKVASGTEGSVNEKQLRGLECRKKEGSHWNSRGKDTRSDQQGKIDLGNGGFE